MCTAAVYISHTVMMNWPFKHVTIARLQECSYMHMHDIKMSNLKPIIYTRTILSIMGWQKRQHNPASSIMDKRFRTVHTTGKECLVDS